MANTLIGHTGFVGSNLLRQLPFGETFHSKNIGSMADRSFGTIYCAGVHSTKWLANQEPQKDLQGIEALLHVLEKVTCDRFILLSTVDVYRSPQGVDEDSPVPTEGLHAYGMHRRMVEDFVQGRFKTHHIIRLPALFGEGLKKNVLYDLLNQNQVERIDPASTYQYYGLDHLGADIATAVSHGLSLVNFSTEPVSVAEIAIHAFGKSLPTLQGHQPAIYDVRTKYASFFQGRDGYLYPKRRILDEIKDFVTHYRKVT